MWHDSPELSRRRGEEGEEFFKDEEHWRDSLVYTWLWDSTTVAWLAGIDVHGTFGEPVRVDCSS